MKRSLIALPLAAADFFAYRSRIHFSVPYNWMNDPNGMVYDPIEEVWHLHYQHCPWEPVWCDMHWGHATSKDLVYWDHQPIAYYSDEIGMIFSGGGILDEDDVAGYGKDTLIYTWTYHKPGDSWDLERQSQAMGHFDRTTKEYVKDGVVIDDDECCIRDPQIVKLANPLTEKNEYYMMLANAQYQNIRYYKSTDLKSWTRTGNFSRNDFPMHESVWECPDLLKFGDKFVQILSVNPGGAYGAPANAGSQTRYYVGDFDFENGVFVSDNADPDEEKVWLDHGPDNYAGVAWRNAPDGEIIMIGWMSNWGYAQEVPADTFRSQMTIPRKLELVMMNDDGSYRLKGTPIDAIEKLRCDGVQYDYIPKGNLVPDIPACGCTEEEMHLLPPIYELLVAGSFSTGELEAHILLYNEQEENVHITIYEDSIRIDRREASGDWENSEWPHYANHTGKRYVDSGDKLDVSFRIIVDLHSVEFFMDDYKTAATALFFPNSHLDKVRVWGMFSKEVRYYQLRSIYADPDHEVCGGYETVPPFYPPTKKA